ncbi:MAG: hypothetical protein JXQ75_00965 [Phycisphaerae bacterium]|nr:hypothetical protein [Phycisphaerae bacterium]
MIGSTKTWDGDEWQTYIVRLLKLHHALGDFQEVPDRHQGDFGIEGFSRDGCAYQCYATEEPLAVRDRFENQRDKITTDIKKFVDNRNDLVKLFGPTLIRRWFLVVPCFDSGPLVQHAEKKAAEVRQHALPYVAADFCITIVTDEEFAPERATLIHLGIERLQVDGRSPDPQEVARWAAQNSTLLKTLDDKIERMPGLSDQRRQAFRSQMIQHYLKGQEVLDLLNTKYQEVFEAAIRNKGVRERFLETECLISDEAPSQLIRSTIQKFKAELLKLDVMTEQMAETLAHEAVADWLMRCPLDFPQLTP